MMSRKIPYYLVLSLVFVALLFSLSPSPELQISDALAQEHGAACRAKERCIAVYITPWCPACKASIPLINAISKRLGSNPSIGFQVIVGQASQSELESMATVFRSKVSFDADAKFFKSMNGRGVPTWWLWDSSGTVLQSFSGAPRSDINMDFAIGYILEQEFGLSDYLNSGSLGNSQSTT